MTDQLRIYLSGPMTGIPDFNYPLFNRAAAEFRARGYHIENPAENPPCDSWGSYMRAAVRQLTTCDRVLMLPGWQESRGAQIERELALDLGIPVDEL